MEKPRRFRKRIVCSVSSGVRPIALRSFSRGSRPLFLSVVPARRSMIRINGIWQRSTRSVSWLRTYFPRLDIEITLERRRGGAEHNGAFLESRPNDGHIAGMVARRILLLVGGFVFLIDHDQPEVFERRKNGAPGADHNPAHGRRGACAIHRDARLRRDGCAIPRRYPGRRRNGS